MAVSRLELILYIFGLIYCVSAEYEKETEVQLSIIVHKAVIGIARGCMQQVNANETDIEYLRQDPPYPMKTSCIVKCLLEKIGIIKNNKYSKMGFLIKITPIVFRNKKKLEHMKNVAHNCEKEINNVESTKCQLGNDVVTCIFKYAPELHMKEPVEGY